MARIISLVLNECDPDVRVSKEAASLRKAGHDVTIIAYSLKGRNYGPDGVIRVPLAKTSVPAKYLDYYAKAWNIIKLECPDAVICNDLNTLYVGIRAKKKLGAKLIYDSHEDFPAQIEGMKGKLAAFPYAVAEKKMITKCDAILTATEQISEIFKRKYGVNSTTILNCPPKTKQGYKKLSNYHTVGYMGALTAKRGIEQMITSADYAADGVNYRVVGDGPIMGSVRKLAQGRRVTIVGKVPPAKVYGETRKFTIGCILFQPDPNHYYAVPNKVFDYMSAGVPILASNFPSLNKLVAGMGEVVDPTSPKRIAETISHMLSDKKKLDAYSRNAFKAHKAKYNWENEEKKLINVVNKQLRR